MNFVYVSFSCCKLYRSKWKETEREWKNELFRKHRKLFFIRKKKEKLSVIKIKKNEEECVAIPKKEATEIETEMSMTCLCVH